VQGTDDRQILMDFLKNLIHEVHRRSLWQVTGIFLAASWGALQVIETITETAGLPDWTPSMALVLLIIGLPICLATAFVQEGMPGHQDDGAEKGGSTGTEAMSAGHGSGPDGAGGTESSGPANLAPGTGSLDRPSTRPSGTRRLLTWKNAILGGVGAFALLGFSLIAYFVMWSAGVGPVGNLVAQGVISQGVRVVLADFDDRTGEGLGEVVTEALRVDLTEAAVLDLADPAEFAETLARMQVARGTALDTDLAMELALRDGFGAVIEGTIAPVGSGYLITASLRDASTGTALSNFRSTAGEPGELIGSIDKLSQDIRERSGESLRDIKGGEPLEQVTTSSLEALRLYSEAEQIFGLDDLRAIELLEDAVSIDPEFAMAWRKLAAAYNNEPSRRPDRAEAARRAYEHRDRLPARERYLAESMYYNAIEADDARAAEALRNLLEIDPDNPTALNNLANTYSSLGDLEAAAELFRRAVDGPGRTVTAYSNLVLVQLALGRVEAAAEAQTEMEEAYPEGGDNALGRFHVLLLSGAESQARALAETRLSDPQLSASERSLAAEWLAKMAYRDGKLTEGREYVRRGASIAAQVNAALEAQRRFVGAYYEAFLGDPSVARESVADLVRTAGFSQMPSTQKAITAWAASVAGGHEIARGILEGAYGPIEPDAPWPRRADILARSAAGDTVGAVAELEMLREVESCLGPQCWTMERAMVAEWSGDLQRARPLYEDEVAGPGAGAWPLLGFHDLFANWRLAFLYEELGDTERAASAYRLLISRWQDADPTVRDRVQEFQQRLAALEAR
jgi:tetratricopeptide (TPR) repeat protein